MIEIIRTNSELVISIAHKHLGRKIGYDQKGVQWLDDYIQKLHQAKNPASEELVSVLGSYLGECIRTCFGGQWTEINGVWGVKFDNLNAAYPFDKVAKQLERGAEDSVLSFFTIIPLLFHHTDKNGA